MPREDYGRQEVVNAELVQVRNKAEAPGQRRNYNYVVRLNTIDPDTGESIMVNEYRTYASDVQLQSQEVLDRMTALIEAGLEAL